MWLGIELLQWEVLALVGFCSLVCFAGGWFSARFCYNHKYVEHVIKRVEAYSEAVESLDEWCAPVSPHAKLITRYFRAVDSENAENSVIVVKRESYSIIRLRDQIVKLDKKTKDIVFKDEQDIR